MRTAALYLRISEDRTGGGVAVDRQRQECGVLAKQLGLAIAEEYVDNDVSATSGATRPGFEKLLRDRPAAIIAWHQDRLLRLTSDLEKVISLNVPVYTVTAGTLDLSNPAGRAVARTVAAWSQYEGEQKAERQRSKNRQKVEAGEPLRGVRPFGLELDRLQVRESEAALIRDAYGRVIGGGSLYGIIQEWNAAGVATTRGKRWSYATLRQMLLRERNAGRLVSFGRVVNSDLSQIVTPEQFEIVRSILSSSSRETRPGPKVTQHFMTGLATCGICGAPLRSASSRSRGRVLNIYKCASKTTGASVGDGLRHPTIQREILEGLVPKFVFVALLERIRKGASPSQEQSPELITLRTLYAETERRRSVAQDLLYEPDVDAARVRRQLAGFTNDLASLTEQISVLLRSNAVSDAYGNARELVDTLTRLNQDRARETWPRALANQAHREAFGRQWAALTVDDKRSLVRATVQVVVNPAAPGDSKNSAALERMLDQLTPWLDDGSQSQMMLDFQNRANRIQVTPV
jgi:site-specific DNA recombinase